MQTIEGLKKRIQSTEDLHAVVKTMKTLAAVSIRQYERALESLRDYTRTVELGLQVVLRNRPRFTLSARDSSGQRPGAIVFGTDQGMCGSLNEQVLAKVLSTLAESGADPKKRPLLAVGERMAALLEDAGERVEAVFSVPGSVAGITPSVQEILLHIEAWNREQRVDRVYIIYSRQEAGSVYSPQGRRLLPIDREWLMELKGRPWPTRNLPQFTMDWDPLFSALISEYLFIALYRAFAEALASENASRLASMQGAEKNIEEWLGELSRQYHQQRQMSITEELLDIVAGFEALKDERERGEA